MSVKPQYDLLVCIRCHKSVDHVLDTAASVEWSVNNKTTKLVFAADRVDPFFIGVLVKKRGKQNVYVAGKKWGWGAGLFGLLCESILYFSKYYQFNHFMTIDYDTLFLKKGADDIVLNQITDSDIGLLGVIQESTRWQKVYMRQRSKLSQVLGPLSPALRCKEGLQGGFMTLTASLISKFQEKGIFKKYSQIVKYTQIADDHLLPIVCRHLGLRLKNLAEFAFCTWKMKKDPRGLEKQGVYVFHPVKAPGKQGNYYEARIREYFRKRRKK